MVRILKSVVLAVVATCFAVALGLIALRVSGHSAERFVERAVDAVPTSLTGSLGRKESESVIENWPPAKGQRFPDLELQDQNGEAVRLSDFVGELILVEYAAVPCEGCQAFAGGKRHGGFAGFRVQRGLDSIEDYASRYAGVDLGEDVVFVQILLYGKDVKAPAPNEVTAWAKHFQMDRTKNEIVLCGTSSLLSRETYDLIPGFQLIDRDFIVRSGSCGHRPQDNLYTDLLPLLGRLARER
ncbi:MAG: hypothetical protein AAFX06_01850 [Planctomycetota bacterium]